MGVYPPGMINSYYSCSVNGQSINDVVAAGAFGELVHFNGITWKNFQTETALQNGTYHAAKIKGNTIVAVGENASRAVILRGYR